MENYKSTYKFTDFNFVAPKKFLKYNIELANEGINEEKLHLFKKVGSILNLKV
jgi:hypothetical protein